MLNPMNGEKFQRVSRYEKKRSNKRKRNINKHHMTNKCKGGKSTPDNLLRMKIERHESLHHYFKNLSWEEIGDVLQSIFNMREPEKCLELVRRISQTKGRSNV